MKKIIGYHLFALIYKINSRLLPIKKNNVLCIMTHDEGEGSNVSLVVKALKRRPGDYTFSYITKKDTSRVKIGHNLTNTIGFFIKKPYQLARAQVVLMDNIFLPYAYLSRRKGSKVIQLWHGTGTIKKFGQDVNTGKLKELEQRANNNITHLIVNSEEMKKTYGQAFGVDENRIFPIGLPKTDELINRLDKIKKDKVNPDKDYIYKKYNISSETKLVLYAPTFRDDEVDDPKVGDQLEELLINLPEGYELGIRLHPHVAEKMMGLKDKRVHQLSFEEDVNTVLLACDILITDYSSIIFEYCLMKCPMIFYSYDLEEFQRKGRGFYHPYQSYVPGPIAYSGKEVCELIKENNFDYDKIDKFIEDNYQYLDGKATERLLNIIEE